MKSSNQNSRIITPLLSGIVTFIIVAGMLYFSIRNTSAQSPNMDSTIKRIATDYIRETLEQSESLDEAVEKVGVEQQEFIQLCLALSIELDFPQRTPQLPPVQLSITEQLNNNQFEPVEIYTYDGVSSTCLLVDKSEHILYLLEYDSNGERRVINSFPCKTGMKTGDKQKEGDERTPEGTFFFVNHYSRNQLRSLVGAKNAFQYGEMAFVTNFPNSIDRVDGKNGSGIWLHGTDEPFEETSPFDTRGCVVVKNEAIQFIQNYIKLYSTPMIIVDHLEIAEKEVLQEDRNEILSIVETWRSSWETKNIDTYIACYAPGFRSQGLNRSQWKERKQYLSTINGNVTINLDNISVMRHNNGVVVQFVQDYRAANTSGKGLKTLYLITGDDNQWQIIDEEFTKL